MFKKYIITILRSLNRMRQAPKITKLANSAVIGHRMKVFVNHNSYIEIGDCSSVHGSIYIEDDSSLFIGSNSTIRFASEINCAQTVSIGDHVIISNNVYITDNDQHPVSVESRRNMTAGDHESELWRNKFAKTAAVVIEDDVWIGQHAVVLKGSTIGKGSIIGANTVVTRNVPPYSLAYGNPANIIPGKYLPK